ncbi:hypothetical protein HDU97_004390 [Phlyctochytrium planicorne]|nr:hypothetical protein HDU97_004390 [Phlyctochytrium planicorne]
MLTSTTSSSPDAGTTAKPTLTIVLFRNDLRLHDNPTLTEALAQKPRHFLPVYIFDKDYVDLSKLSKGFVPPTTRYFGFPRCSQNRMRFQLESVENLQSNLRSIYKSDLLLLYGSTVNLMKSLVKTLKATYKIKGIFMQKEVTDEEIKVEDAIAKINNAPLKLVWGSTVVHEQDLPFDHGVDGVPDVFTMFRKRVEGMETPVRDLVENPLKWPPLPDNWESLGEGPRDVERLWGALGVSKEIPKINAFPFKGGEHEALRRLDEYFWGTKKIDSYKETRNGLIGSEYSSKFSPYLAFGCISPRYINYELKRVERSRGENDGTYWLWFELLWRDYFKFVAMKYGVKIFALNGFRRNGDKINWKHNFDHFEEWRKGTTGVPWVDANMRELETTGFMSNRGRQNVASFLAKDLGIDWRMGAEWFESQLIDHDPASNYLNWQYVAGVGNDPREDRRFNMIKQAKDYDPQGKYVKLWLPELRHVSDRDVHMPWKANGVDVGDVYRVPIYLGPAWDGQGQRWDNVMAKGNRGEKVYSKGNRGGKW